MVFPDSCFGYTLQTGVKLVALTQLVIAVILIGMTIGRITAADHLEAFVICGVFLAIQFFQILAALFLFEGSKERNMRSCQFWLGATFILTTATIFYSAFEMYDNRWMDIHLSPYIILSSVSVICNIVFMWITYGFVEELKAEDGEGGTVYNDT